MTVNQEPTAAFGVSDALAPLCIYANGDLPGALVRWTRSRGEVALAPYLDVTEVAPPTSDVLIVIHASEFSAASALVDEVLATRDPGRTVHLAIASLPAEFDRALLNSHLASVRVDDLVDLGDYILLAVSGGADRGDLADTVWLLARTVQWLRAGVDESRDARGGREFPVPTAPEAEGATPAAAPDTAEVSAQTLAADATAPRGWRNRIPQRWRGRAVGLTLAVAMIALGIGAVVADGDLAAALGVAAFLAATALVLLLILLLRREVLAQGRRIAALDRTHGIEMRRIRRSLTALHNDVGLSRSQGAIMLESLNERARMAAGSPPSPDREE